MTEQSATTHRGPGSAVLLLMLAAQIGGVGLLLGLAPAWNSWQAGAACGYGFSGLLGLSSLWALRRALRASGQAAFTRAVFGAMGVRLLLSGLAAGLVIGFAWLSAKGFVGGLFGGLLIFQTVEIAGVLSAARRGQGSAEGEPHHAS